VSEVRDYRRHVDAAMRALLSGASDELLAAHAATIEVGIHHEEQHQELILTDVKHVLASNPLGADYRRRPAHPSRAAAPLEWRDQAGGTIALGHPGGEFSYDNEQPRHRVWLEPFQLASRAVTCGEWLAFITDGGYRKPELWLAEGFDACVAGRWRAPLYWEARDGAWTIATLDGRRPLDESEPVCHVSWFEADAFARFSGARLPSEAEWELAASGQPVRGNFVESGALHPRPATNPPGGLAQLFGDVWEWTASPYRPYPGYRPFQGALAEYNGKFMCNQFVLRGGSCASPERHLRATYRNFFPPTARWQFTGLRLARDGR
jgi:ergothioneine biosynthesis protein EgtB